MVGFSLIGNYLRWVSIKEKAIDSSGEIKLPFNADEKLSIQINDNKQIKNITEQLSSSISSVIETEDSAAFCLDPSAFFQMQLPVDENETPGETSARIIWDLAAFYPDNYRQYAVNYAVSSSTSIIKSRIFAYSLHKNIIQLLTVFSSAGRLKLKFVDMAPFSISHLLNGKETVLVYSSPSSFAINVQNNSAMQFYDFALSGNINSKNFKEWLASAINDSALMKCRKAAYYTESSELKTDLHYRFETAELMPEIDSKLIPAYAAAIKAIDANNSR